MSVESRLVTIAGLCLAAFFALGYSVTHPIGLWRFDSHANVLRGQGLPWAILFTQSGRALPLLALALAGIAIAAVTRYQVVAAVVIFAAQLVSQAAVEGLKHVFHRARPDSWIYHEELGYSYPSGHATTAVVFFGSWLVLVLMSPLPKGVKVVLAAVLATWMIGIDWSRLALGAHYLTDVIGGTLFGIACASIVFASLLHFRALAI